MRKIYTLFFHMIILVFCIGIFVSQSNAVPIINVTVTCNTATCLDTLKANHLVQMCGTSVFGTTPAISWTFGSSITLTNIGGDYWQTTIQALPGDTLQFKFVAGFDALNPTFHWSGWEGPLNSGTTFGGSNRVLIVGMQDTTLPVQYFNGWENTVDQYAAPFVKKQDTVAVYVRVNMAGEADFNPATQVPSIYGDVPLGSGSWPKIIDLTREVNSPGGAFWSGVAYIAKSSVSPVQWQNYKFVYNGNWETGGNRFFPFTENMVNVTGDTTIHWVYFSDRAPSTEPTVNVTLGCNTSTCLDTLQTSHIVGVGGESQKGVPGLNWSATLDLTNMGGDYWQTTIAAHPGDTIYYSFVTKYDSSTFSKVNWGWDGPIDNGVNTRTNRMLVVGSNDTTLPLQYYNGWTTKVGQYAKPFVVKSDTIAVYFRVNMGGVTFNPSTQTVEVQGGIGSASWTKIADLTREVNSINGGSFWSGTAYVAKGSVVAGNQQKYKFVFRSPETWESTSDRSFYFSNNVINIAGDTTIHWNYFNNKAPSGPAITSDVFFSLKLNALENAGLFNRALGDRVGVTGAKGWAADPVNFDTTVILKMTYNSTFQEWDLNESFTLFPNDVIVFKYYIAWDPSRVDSTSPNFIRGLALSNGWEEPGVTGGADRRYTFTDVTPTQYIPGDFGADQQFFNSIHPYGCIATPCTLTFSVNMAPAANVATNPTNALFRPGTDSVFISFDGCMLPITQGKTMYGTDNRLELLDGDGDGIYTGTIALKAPTLYQICYRVTYSSYPNPSVTNGGGILSGRRYYQYIRPTQVQAGGNITWPASFTLPTMDWKLENLTIETPPDLETPTGVGTTDQLAPGTFALMQNYPNPFNPSTVITYSVAQRTQVTLDIYNVLGQKVITLFDKEQSAGTHSIVWNGSDSRNRQLSSGVYFLKMRAGSYSSLKKMLLMK